MASKTVTRSFTQDTDKTYLKAYPLSKQRVLYIGIPSCCLYLRVIFSTFILLDKIIVPIKPCDMSLNEVMFLIFFCVEDLFEYQSILKLTVLSGSVIAVSHRKC